MCVCVCVCVRACVIVVVFCFLFALKKISLFIFLFVLSVLVLAPSDYIIRSFSQKLGRSTCQPEECSCTTLSVPGSIVRNSLPLNIRLSASLSSVKAQLRRISSSPPFHGMYIYMCLHTPSIAFWHVPPNYARFGYATEGALFISALLSTDAVSALRKVWVLI